MLSGQKINKPLFSQHYLDYQIQECPEWQLDLTANFNDLKNLYLSERNSLPKMNEAETENKFIQPALNMLGFSYIVQLRYQRQARYTIVIDGDKVRDPCLDYALYGSETDRHSAYGKAKEIDSEIALKSALAIAEAKYWQRPLSRDSENDKRDGDQNHNPSFQIASYLRGTGVDWGILTNGQEWRLYYRQASSIATEFYQIDLVEMLTKEDIENFKYFWLFFRKEAFVKDSQGRNFLERVIEGSKTYAIRVGNELKKIIFDQVFPDLAGGFVADAHRNAIDVTSAQVYEATLSFLYKLLFLLYAEARNLLPIDGNYRDYSLVKLTEEIAKSVDFNQKLSDNSTVIYDQLLRLFKIIDQGDRALEVPSYNGGLFHFNFTEFDPETAYQANHFLDKIKVSDAVLSQVLDRLARSEKQPIDYSFLGVRQLGAIYEGLLEYRVIIEDANTGKVYLANDQGERKATGSYYTPDYIVKYIVSHTLDPVLEERQAEFAKLMKQIINKMLEKEQLENHHTEKENLNKLAEELAELERKAQNTLLDIKVCDPAMGSGHFLVETVDYLTDKLIDILTEYPQHNPILKTLYQIQESIVNNLKDQGIKISLDRLQPTQLLQRLVIKRCIYGVDLNPMAVELAKVSLWLHSFTIGAPLSFLDHHLRCGNSLVGTTIKEANGLLKATEIVGRVRILSDTNFAQVKESEIRFFDQTKKPYKQLLNVYLSQFFGVKQANNFLERFATNSITVNPENMKKTDKAVYNQAEKLSREKRFFHWDLEFPEVFIDIENDSWKDNAGFDVVLGNPPYIDSEEMSKTQPDLRSFITKNWQSGSGNWDLFIIFVEAGIKLSKTSGYSGMIVPNKLLGAEYAKEIQAIMRKKTLINICDYSKVKVFDADVYPIVYIISNHPSKFNDEIDLSQIFKVKDPNSAFESRRFLATIEIVDKLPKGYWWALFSPCFKLIEKVLLLSEKLENIATIQAAASTAEAYEIKPLIQEYDNLSQTNTALSTLMRYNLICRDAPWRVSTGPAVLDYNENCCIAAKLQFINTGIIDRYTSLWGIEKMTYLKNIYKKPVILLDELAKISLNRVRQSTQPKIILAGMTVTLEAYYDAEGIYLAGKSTVTIFSVNYSNLYLLAIINSKICNLTYKEMFGSLALQGDYLTIGKAQASNIPIRKINFTTPPDIRQQSLESLINFYQNYQNNGNFNDILSQVKYHLNQRPESADIIHDFLAYLADKMLVLNQEKQAKIQEFLQGLECLIGCPIDNLTNKAKIQNYLGDYDKDEPYLSFTELIEVLKKNKKHLKIDPDIRQDQAILEQEYQQSLESLLPIKSQLKKCDILIDEIVYCLYGLTADERAIIAAK